MLLKQKKKSEKYKKEHIRLRSQYANLINEKKSLEEQLYHERKRAQILSQENQKLHQEVEYLKENLN